MLERFQEISRLLSESSVIADQNQFKALSKEYAQLEATATCYSDYTNACKNLESLEELSAGNDQEMADMANEEIETIKENIKQLDEELQWHLIPKDPDDERNIYI